MSTLKEVCKKMVIEEDTKFMKQSESIAVESKTGDKEDLDQRNWNKPSKAVVASDGNGNGCIIFHCGPHIEEEIKAVGRELSNLGLDDCPEGIWVWEGIYRGIIHPSTPNGPEEYDTEIDGKFRSPEYFEWSYIKENRCPWRKEEWLKDYKEDEKAAEQEFTFDLAKQEDKTIMAKYDLCNEQNVAALQKSKYIDFYDFKLTNNQEPSLEGDCVAQCLNCVWNGWAGYKCTCGHPMMSMDSDRIRKEKENGEEGRRMKMKCSGCRAGLPLGSGRYHYDFDNGNVATPCTHNPNTGEAYDQSTGEAYQETQQLVFPPIQPPEEYQIQMDKLNEQIKKIYTVEDFVLNEISLTKEENYGVVVQRTDLNPRRKCDCGGTKCGLTHSNWCSTQEK